MTFFPPYAPRPWTMDPINYGWTCPKCGRVYSPITPQCWMCNQFPTIPAQPPLTTDSTGQTP